MTRLNNEQLKNISQATNWNIKRSRKIDLQDCWEMTLFKQEERRDHFICLSLLPKHLHCSGPLLGVSQMKAVLPFQPWQWHNLYTFRTHICLQFKDMGQEMERSVSLGAWRMLVLRAMFRITRHVQALSARP